MDSSTPALFDSSPALKVRYSLTRTAFPVRIRYRNAVVVLEVVRDCSASLTAPVWVLRARKVQLLAGGPINLPVHVPTVVSANGPTQRAAFGSRYSGPVGTRVPVSFDRARPLPTINPADLRRTLAGVSTDAIVLLSTSYGRHAIREMLRSPLVVAAGSPESRILDALVGLGYARVAGSIAV